MYTNKKLNKEEIQNKIIIDLSKSDINFIFTGSFALYKILAEKNKPDIKIEINDLDVDMFKLNQFMELIKSGNKEESITESLRKELKQNIKFHIKRTLKFLKGYQSQYVTNVKIDFDLFNLRKYNKDTYGLPITIIIKEKNNDNKIEIKIDLNFESKNYNYNKKNILINNQNVLVNVYEIEKLLSDKILAIVKRNLFVRRENNTNNINKLSKDIFDYNYIYKNFKINEEKLDYNLQITFPFEKYNNFKNVADIKIKLREMLSKYNNLGKNRNSLINNNNLEKNI